MYVREGDFGPRVKQAEQLKQWTAKEIRVKDKQLDIWRLQIIILF
jgi:hypothetical protein